MNKKLKIAIIGSRGYPYVYSGYETLVKELSERLVKRGYHLRVYCHSSLFKKKPKKVNGIELIYTPSIETKFLSQIVNSFFSFIHVCFSKIDVILVVNSANGPFGLFTKIFAKKTCINVDGLEWLRPKWKGFGSFYFKISSKFATLFFDEIITDSSEMYIIYKEIFDIESNVIAYGSTMVRTKSKNFLKKNNLKQNDYYLIVGRLIPDNNSNLIIKGFLKSSSSKKIVIVGDVTYKDYYASQVKKMAAKNVIFTGYINCQEKLTQLYQNCFCYIHGHEFGGTNPTMVNALHLNAEIIALKTKFNIEMLENKKSIFFEKTIDSVANTINFFEKNHFEQREFNSNYILNEKYNWEIITEKYLDLFNKIYQFPK